MIENRNYPKLIDDYLAGNLTDANKLAFEKKLSIDSELRNEFELQKEIVNSIKDVNYDEIKSEVLEFWKDQKINKLHDNLKDELFKG